MSELLCKFLKFYEIYRYLCLQMAFKNSCKYSKYSKSKIGSSNFWKYEGDRNKFWLFLQRFGDAIWKLLPVTEKFQNINSVVFSVLANDFSCNFETCYSTYSTKSIAILMGKSVAVQWKCFVGRKVSWIRHVKRYNIFQQLWAKKLIFPFLQLSGKNFFGERYSFVPSTIASVSQEMANWTRVKKFRENISKELSNI